MATVQPEVRGSVVGVWRYPVKSMMGEELNATEVAERGLVGDRAFALVDPQSGKVVSAKNPRKWGNLFEFRASFLAPPRDPDSLPSVRISLPDGEQVTTDQPDAADRLSASVGKPVRLMTAGEHQAPVLEGYWPDYDWLEARDVVFNHDMPLGTFFDMGHVHLLTTATIDSLRSHAPQSRFEIRRFRPNFVLELDEGARGFVEDDWVGRTLALGRDVRLRIFQTTPRCVMTTLSQGDLPKDPVVLRTAVQLNYGNVGVYAAVVQGGQVRRGDSIGLE